jgi:histidinol-phosphate phosphatase family protein
MKLNEITIDKNWTLFLDRDGVINHQLPNNYVKNIEEFRFIDGAREAIAEFTKDFGRIVLVTNQQGIGKGLMTKEDLKRVHDYMQMEIMASGGKIDDIYFSPDLASSNSNYRKPNTGMAEEARKNFPEIDFLKSIMVGDSLSDMQMGKRVGMFTLFISNSELRLKEADFQMSSLKEVKEVLFPQSE